MINEGCIEGMHTVDSDGKAFESLVCWEFSTRGEKHSVQLEHKAGTWRILSDGTLVATLTHNKTNPLTFAKHSMKFIVKTGVSIVGEGVLQGELVTQWAITTGRWGYRLRINNMTIKPASSKYIGWTKRTKKPVEVLGQPIAVDPHGMLHWAQGVHYFGYRDDADKGPGAGDVQCTGVPIKGPNPLEGPSPLRNILESAVTTEATGSTVSQFFESSDRSDTSPLQETDAHNFVDGEVLIEQELGELDFKEFTHTSEAACFGFSCSAKPAEGSSLLGMLRILPSCENSRQHVWL